MYKSDQKTAKRTAQKIAIKQQLNWQKTTTKQTVQTRNSREQPTKPKKFAKKIETKLP